MKNDTLIGRHAKSIREAFTPLIPPDRPLALTGYPDSVNCGDHAIWLGEMALLTELGLAPAYRCSVRNYDRDTMRQAIGNGTILMHGGANFGDRHALHHEFRLRLLKDFSENKIILFPQQVTAQDMDYLKQIAGLIAAHPDVTLFACSAIAQQMFGQCFGGNVKIKLAPGMAFMLGPQPRKTAPAYDIVWLGRTDDTKANDRTETAARLASQAAEKFVLPQFPDGLELNLVVKHRPPTVLLTDWYSLCFENELTRIAYDALGFDVRSKLLLARAFHLLSLGHVAITDRLHGHILCLLLGVPHVLLNNASGKNWNFHEDWTRESGLCHLAKSPAEAWTIARNLLPRAKELQPAQA